MGATDLSKKYEEAKSHWGQELDMERETSKKLRMELEWRVLASTKREEDQDTELSTLKKEKEEMEERMQKMGKEYELGEGENEEKKKECESQEEETRLVTDEKKKLIKLKVLDLI